MPSVWKNFWQKFIQPIGNYDDIRICVNNAYVLTQRFLKLKVTECWMQAIQEDLKFTEFACHANLETHTMKD